MVVHYFGLGDRALEVGGEGTDELKGLSALDVELLELGGDEGFDECILALGSGH